LHYVYEKVGQLAFDDLSRIHEIVGTDRVAGVVDEPFIIDAQAALEQMSTTDAIGSIELQALFAGANEGVRLPADEPAQ
jgi:hypothetical protein